MAEVAKVILERLEVLLQKEARLLGSLQADVQDIRAELDSIKSVVQEADTSEESAVTRAWMRQAREVSYDIEDALEEFVLHFGGQQKTGLFGFFQGGAHYLQKLGVRRRIATQIENLRVHLHGMSVRKTMYDVNWGDNRAITTLRRVRTHDRHVASLFIDETELVGIEKPKQQLIDWLLEDDTKKNIISVVGMGGLGKTTLVRKVYDDEQVKTQFKCHCWITVTQTFTVEELLRSTTNKFFEEVNNPLPEKIDTMDAIQLTELLRYYLRDKRYIVVFDDVWDINAWHGLKYALPDGRNCSRILMTTRNADIASSSVEPSGHIYNLQPLQPKEAWILFCRKAFGKNPEKIRTQELESLAQDIAKTCDGLPLAIVAIGGLLSKKKSVSEWKKLHDNLHAELANNPKLEQIKRILLLSYNDLPHQLKSCFLYFSNFPKGYMVKRITLIRMWTAEGFIDRANGELMEKTAEDNLNELVDRSIVQVAENYDYGRVRRYKVHDLIHDISILKSEEENFSTSLNITNKAPRGRIRRLSIHGTSNNNSMGSMDLSHLRAFFMFGSGELSSYMLKLFSGFRILKVLDLDGIQLEKFPLQFVHLLHLRYLSLRNTKVKELPKSLGKLRNLETLDLKGTYVSELPKSILKLRNLRHLLAYHYHVQCRPPFYYTYGVTVPQGIGKLRELQKLSYLVVNQDTRILTQLGKLTQLKRLGIVKFRTGDGSYLCDSLQKMRHLCALSVTSIDSDEFLDLEILPNPPPLERLYLRGPMKRIPDWIASLQNLVKVKLRWSRLIDSSLHVLQDLPQLIELTLIKAYDEETLCFKGGFVRLRMLDIEQLNISCLLIVDGSMPNLRRMYIRSCELLETVSQGIEELLNLKELHLFGMSELFVSRLRKDGQDYPKVKHIPLIRCYDNQDRFYEEL